jgi:CpeT/CpcT family (DUF1001)
MPAFASPQLARSLTLLASLSVGLSGCTAPQVEPEVVEVAPTAAQYGPELTELCDWMTGSFSSAAQAVSDPEGYFDIRLEMVRIWPLRTDGIWLYVEQAAADSLDKPYRQRVYQVFETQPGTYASVVYLVPGEALRFAGGFADPSLLADLRPAELELRTGCGVFLVRSEGAFAGSTGVGTCPSSLRGAAYATSDITIAADVLTSWDRGYDFRGVQVWGATKGPYVFDKVADYPLQ